MIGFKRRTMVGAMGSALALCAGSIPAQPICCINCGGTGPTRKVVATPRMEFVAESPALGRFRALASRNARMPAEGATRSKFIGAVPGSWDDVDGYYTIPYFVPGTGELDILLRGFPAQRVDGSDIYVTPDWDRSVYWLEIGGAQPPRLLQALELDDAYVPASGDAFFDAVDNGPGSVTGDCTLGAGCTLNLVPYVRYREAGVDYSAPTFPHDPTFPGSANGFEEVSMVFVTDAAGDAIDAKVLLDDGRMEPFFMGDRIQLATLAYRMTEPDYIYALGYMDFVTLDQNAAVTRRNYIPGVSFVDPDLPADLDAGNRRVRLVLDASVAAGDGYGTGGDRSSDTTGYAYGGPFDLGFSWQNAAVVVHADSFEVPLARAQAAATKAGGRAGRWVKPRSD